jgi:hypothetical protein
MTCFTFFAKKLLFGRPAAPECQQQGFSLPKAGFCLCPSQTLKPYFPGMQAECLLPQKGPVIHSTGYSMYYSATEVQVEALSGLIRPPRRKPNCNRTATRRHLLPLDATCCHMNATSCHWMPLVATWKKLKMASLLPTDPSPR